ncbi:hypothetical protein [Cellulophaga sp. Asnod2-G02]|uniref:hypothetical protein n=1 Tax=Cellulophaga sp. Asnod2-G02 TaxID=3160572 RepID=UPI00386503AF
MKSKKILISVLIGCLPFLVGLNKIFFGFEYEDAFINSHVGLQDNISFFFSNFRTKGCTEYFNGNCHELKAYPGHYISYAFLIKVTSFIYSNPYFTHRFLNFFLVVISFSSLILLLPKDIFRKEILPFFLIIISLLPFMYVFNSSLIENLSFSLGIIIIVVVYLNDRNESEKLKILFLILIGVICIIKRENLVYFFLIPLIFKKEDCKNYRLLLATAVILLIQIVINPFYTEGIESKDLNRSTFSIDYLAFQLPVYLKSLVSIKGFLFLTIFALLRKPNKKSIYFIFVFILFLVTYSLHYRSRYAIESSNISLLETYRYLVNTIPFVLGYILFSKGILFKYPKFIYGILIASVLSYNYSFHIMEDFINDEIRNYHVVNEIIEDSLNDTESCLILDNFVLISLLNKKNMNIDIIEYNTFIYQEYQSNSYDKIYLINRFGTSKIKIDSHLRKIDSLSKSSTDVYQVIGY